MIATSSHALAETHEREGEPEEGEGDSEIDEIHDDGSLGGTERTDREIRLP